MSIQSTKKRNFFVSLGCFERSFPRDTTAEVDKGRRPFDPCKLLIKFDQNLLLRLFILILPAESESHDADAFV